MAYDIIRMCENDVDTKEIHEYIKKWMEQKFRENTHYTMVWD